MSEGFGGQEGWHDWNDAIGVTTTQVEDARRASHHGRDPGSWPEAGTVAKAVLLTFAAIVGGGWLVTLLTAPR